MKNIVTAVRRKRRAFTLAEVVVASSILLLVITLSLGLFMTITRMNVRTELKDLLDSDFRSITRVLADQARTANTFRVYKSFSDRTEAGAGQGGDLVVLVSFSTADIGEAPNSQRISRVIGVFRENSMNKIGAIRSFDSDTQDWGQGFGYATPAAAGAKIKDLLPPATFLASCPVLAGLTLGTAGGGTDLNAFFNINGTSFLVNGMVYKETTTSGSGISGYQSKNAYNLTITPRS